MELSISYQTAKVRKAKLKFQWLSFKINTHKQQKMILHFKMIIDNLLRILFTKGKSSFFGQNWKKMSLSKNPVFCQSNENTMNWNNLLPWTATTRGRTAEISFVYQFLCIARSFFEWFLNNNMENVIVNCQSNETQWIEINYTLSCYY